MPVLQSDRTLETVQYTSVADPGFLIKVGGGVGTGRLGDGVWIRIGEE